MLKVNLDTNVNNLIFLNYMKQQEQNEDDNGQLEPDQEKESTTNSQK